LVHSLTIKQILLLLVIPLPLRRMRSCKYWFLININEYGKELQLQEFRFILEKNMLIEMTNQ
jgi:hypothetical protein